MSFFKKIKFWKKKSPIKLDGSLYPLMAVLYDEDYNDYYFILPTSMNTNWLRVKASNLSATWIGGVYPVKPFGSSYNTKEVNWLRNVPIDVLEVAFSNIMRRLKIKEIKFKEE